MVVEEIGQEAEASFFEANSVKLTFVKLYVCVSCL